MPSKKVIKLNAFEGGLNNSADARDISSTQLAGLTDMSITSLGRLTMLGGFTEHEATLGDVTREHNLKGSDDPEAGYGIFSFAMDNRIINTSTGALLDPSLHNQQVSYISLFHNQDDEAEVTFFQRMSPGIDSDVYRTWLVDGSEFDLGPDHKGTGNPGYDGVKLNTYVHNGILRISDGGQSFNNKIKWMGVVNPKQYGDADSGTGVTGFYGGVKRTGADANYNFKNYEAELKGCFIEDTNGDAEISCLNAIMSPSDGLSEFSGGPTISFGNSFTTLGRDHDNPHGTFQYATGMRWGCHLAFSEAGNETGTWQMETNQVYKFWISTMYDNGTQESKPQLFTHYATSQLGGPTDPNWGFLTNETGKSGLKFSNMNAANRASGTFDSEGKEISLYLQPIFKLTAADDFDVNTDAEVGYYNFGSSTVGSQTADGNQRISGCNIYWSSTLDGHSELWKIFECDFAKGAKSYGQSNTGGGTSWSPWKPHQALVSPWTDGSDGIFIDTTAEVDGTTTMAHGGTLTYVQGYKIGGQFIKPGTTVAAVGSGEITLSQAATGTDTDMYVLTSRYSNYHYITPDFGTIDINKWIHPPTFESYYNSNTNHHAHDDAISVNSFKTSAFCNNRIYIGNVNQTIDGVAIQYSDRIIKGNVGQVDKFPEKNFLEAAVNDGAAIIHLASYGDRLLEFKENAMYIINAGEAEEYIESTHHFKGVTHPASVCTTDLGIAWANKNGAYIYDGAQIRDLLEQGGQRLIDATIWESFAKVPMVGYHPGNKQLIIADDVGGDGDGSVYIFNIITRSWTKGAPHTILSDTKSNFINDYHDELIYYDYSVENGTMKKWVDTPAQSAFVEVLTKDFDFDAPGVKKRVYKVYISYKGDARNVQVHYGVDGATPTSTFYPITSGTDGSSTGTGATAKCIPYDAGTNDWLTAELKPGASINNINSFQIKISGDESLVIAADFEINDISIIYRIKRIK